MKIQSQLQPAASHFVLPDLPSIYTEQDRDDFCASTLPQQRIHTIATCRHRDHRSLLKAFQSSSSAAAIHESSKILLVGGNDKSLSSLSTTETAKILRDYVANELWGVANPNDPNSVENVQAKTQAGIQGIITQPLLSSTAKETLYAYRELENGNTGVSILAGLAFPTTAKSLQFWARLLEQQDELQRDPLFQSHLAFFSQPYNTPLSWIGRECQELLSYLQPEQEVENEQKSRNKRKRRIDGIHCMPLHNIDDLVTIFQSFNAQLPRPP
jgi:hypothetical protein